MPESARDKLLYGVCILAVVMVAWRLFFSGGDDDAALTSTNPDKRLIAIEGLWKKNDEEARGKLRQMTEDPDQRVVLQSIRGLGHNRDDANRRHLESFAVAQREPLYRREALAALGNYDDVPVTTFTGVITTEKDAQVRAGAAQALARRAEKSTVPVMFRALSDPHAEVRVWAITGIKNVTKVGFMYDAELPPQDQMKVIQEIGAYLRRNGYM